MHVGYSHFVTEYVLSDNSGEHVKLTEVDYERDPDLLQLVQP